MTARARQVKVDQPKVSIPLTVSQNLHQFRYSTISDTLVSKEFKGFTAAIDSEIGWLQISFESLHDKI